jgi:DNA polymerase elongation subunit (family B)
LRLVSTLSSEALLQPRVLFLDTENAPNLGYVWGKWEQNVIDFKSNWFFLSFAYKWQGSRAIHCKALSDYPLFKKDPENDRELVKDLWAIINDADVIIAHNGDRFDLRKANARFVAQGMKPPSPYKTVDTLKIARRYFQFDSNKLDDLGKYLGVGRKLPHTGKHLWFGCMSGDPKSWATMRRYNSQDVALLERVYLKLRPWAATHPNLTHITRLSGCPTCQSTNLTCQGFKFSKAGKRQQFQCKDCGSWSSDGPLIKVA